jgi:hypothetical protein
MGSFKVLVVSHLSGFRWWPMGLHKGKIILVNLCKRANIDARQSSGVRSSSFTAKNAGISSEAVFSRSVVNLSEPARYFLVT